MLLNSITGTLTSIENEEVIPTTTIQKEWRVMDNQIDIQTETSQEPSSSIHTLPSVNTSYKHIREYNE